MKRPQKGSTIKQYAYATRKLGGQGSSKKEIALLSGFSPSVAANAKNKIENTEGYNNAVIVLAAESNNLLLAVLSEFKARGLRDFSNADLTKALNAITGAWTKIEEKRAPSQMKTPEGNPLRGVFQRRVETQTVTIEPVPSNDSADANTIHVEVTPVEDATPTPEIDLDF